MFFDLFARKKENAYKENVVKNFKIKEQIEKIKSIGTTEERVNFARELLVTTDIIKTEDALYQFDNEQWHSEDNYLKKYLEYKNGNDIIYKGVDCDVSILCVVMYCLLNGGADLDKIVNQYGSNQKYEIRSNNSRFKGDTLTSALCLLKLYLGCLWKKIDSDPQMQKSKKYKDFYQLFNKIANTGVPVAPNGDWIEYCSLNSEIIWNAIDDEAKSFFRCYNMFGNYMCIPGNSYQTGEKRWTSFNISRSNMGKWDTVDTLLIKIYGYFYYNDITYLEAIFTDKKEELVSETKKWLDQFGNWRCFLEKNALYAYVDKISLVPISLKTGKQVNVSDAKKYNAIPKTYSEFLCFFDEVSRRIMMRNEEIHSRVMLLR